MQNHRRADDIAPPATDWRNGIAAQRDQVPDAHAANTPVRFAARRCDASTQVVRRNDQIRLARRILSAFMCRVRVEPSAP